MLNETIIEGRISQDLELKTTGNGVSVCSFSIATKRNYKVNDEYPTDFFNVVAWRSKAEFICNNFKKGDRVFIVGSFETRKYTDSNDVNRIAFELKAEKVYFGEHKARNDTAPAEEEPHFGRNSASDFADVSDEFDDIPFG